MRHIKIDSIKIHGYTQTMNLNKKENRDEKKYF